MSRTNKAHLKAAAEAFAGVDKISSACYHYLEGGYHNAYQLVLITYYLSLIAEQTKPPADNDHPLNINIKYIEPVIITALTEQTYPVQESKVYAWSDRQRAAFAGISKSTWSDNKLSDAVNFIIDDMRSKSHSTWLAVQLQMQADTKPHCQVGQFVL